MRWEKSGKIGEKWEKNLCENILLGNEKHSDEGEKYMMEKIYKLG